MINAFEFLVESLSDFHHLILLQMVYHEGHIIQHVVKDLLNWTRFDVGGVKPTQYFTTIVKFGRLAPGELSFNLTHEPFNKLQILKVIGFDKLVYL